MKISEQRVGDSHFFGERFVRPGAIDAQAEHLRIERFKLLQIVDKTGVFVGANRAEIEWIKNQYDVALAREVRKLDFLLRLVFQREVGSGLSYGNRHEASSELEQMTVLVAQASAGGVWSMQGQKPTG